MRDKDIEMKNRMINRNMKGNRYGSGIDTAKQLKKYPTQFFRLSVTAKNISFEEKHKILKETIRIYNKMRRKEHNKNK